MGIQRHVASRALALALALLCVTTVAQAALVTIEVTGIITPGSVASPWPLLTAVPADGSVVTVDYTIDNTTPASFTYGPDNTGQVYSGALISTTVTIAGVAYPLSPLTSSLIGALSNGQCATCVPPTFEDNYQVSISGTYAPTSTEIDVLLYVDAQATSPLGTIVTSTAVDTAPALPASPPAGFLNDLSILYAGSQLLDSTPATIRLVPTVANYPAGTSPPVTPCSPSPCSVPVNIPLNGQIIENLQVAAATPAAQAALAAANGTITKQLCTVAVDPRLALYGTCTGHTQAVSDVCPGFGTTVIPPYLCGAPGFALLRGQADALDAIPGLLFTDVAHPDLALEGVASSACPFATIAWAPLSTSTVETPIPEGNLLIDVTDGCGTEHCITKGESVVGLGLTLNTDALPGTTLISRFVNFGATKFANLQATISAANIAAPERANIAACVAASSSYSQRGEYACAARRILKCDQEVAQNAASYLGSDSNTNPYGDVRSRLANLYLNTNTRVLGLASPSSWPVALASAPACQIDDWATQTPAAVVPGDLNGDGVVNCADAAIVKAALGKSVGQPGYDPRADVNGDGIVNIVDLSTEARLLPAGLVCH